MAELKLRNEEHNSVILHIVQMDTEFCIVFNL